MVRKDVFNTKIKDIEDKIPDYINIATNTTLNAKINEVRNKIPSFTNLVAITTLTVENNILDHNKYITKSTVENFNARLKQANLVTKGDIAVL